MTVRLPLFPLGTVLFPGVLLPLHVFEDRYRQLVRDLQERPEDQQQIGVLAIREGREVGPEGIAALHPVGCVAQLRRVESYPDGRFDIVTTGSQRFRLLSLVEGKPYLQGEVEPLDDPSGTDADAVAVTVAEAFIAYLDAVGAAVDDEPPRDPTTLSYLVAASTVLDLTDKQRLLQAPDTTSRLSAELALLRREVSLLSLLPSLPAVELTRMPASPN